MTGQRRQTALGFLVDELQHRELLVVAVNPRHVQTATGSGILNRLQVMLACRTTRPIPEIPKVDDQFHAVRRCRLQPGDRPGRVHMPVPRHHQTLRRDHQQRMLRLVHRPRMPHRYDEKTATFPAQARTTLHPSDPVREVYEIP